MAAKVFSGVTICLSRSLVPPELFDALHDALKFNGAQVLLICDPSRNGPNDYHVIASPEHEKFEYLRSKGCNLLGPQCVLFCAKEHRKLPIQGYTCCLALDGVNIVMSGFEKDVKDAIRKKVTAMGGQMKKKASSDVSFVIVKDVLCQKYKWALTQVKKPMLTIDWLEQCWKEHRVVPQEPYRVLPFAGLTICVSGIPADERKEVEKLVVQNGGIYSAELTKRCSHLICDAPEGDKYTVAKRWRIIYIVNRKWFHQSIARRACLMEDSFPVQHPSSVSTLKTLEHHTQGKGTRNSQPTSSSIPTASESDTNLFAQDLEPDVENLLTNIRCTSSEVPHISKKGNDPPTDKQKNGSDFTRCIADDSQSEDDDLYLSECRILLLGFEASELRKLVNMIRRGGGSRYMSVREKLTHVVVGIPSENEIKEIRSLAAFGVISIVKTSWLEECTIKKKEVPVFQGHIAYDLLLPKDSIVFNGSTAASTTSLKEGNSSASQLVDNNIVKNKNSQSDVLFGLKEDAKVKVQSRLNNGIKHMKSSTVFRGKLFRFSSTFPEEQRPEIVMWVTEGGGEVVSDQNRKIVHFIVERHGVVSCLTHASWISYITTHWIHSCLEEGCLLDISSHILYSPLPCKIPLPGFEEYRLCFSGYGTKERQLLRNLCYVLGVKYAEKLTKKATHLLSKFAHGDKYEAACRWGINVVTADWIYECAKQNKVVDVKGFFPKELTSQDRQEGSFFMSQYPAHSDRITSVDDISQHPSQQQDLGNVHTIDSLVIARDVEICSRGSKRARLLGQDSIKQSSCDSAVDNFVSRTNHAENNTENNGVSSVVPDVAAAIEDLLEQTSKIQDLKSQETSGSHETFLSSNPTMLSQRHAASSSELGPSKQWINRLEERHDDPSDDAGQRGFYDNFSETQTDSQVVGYEEDLSGRQMIIDRVRTRSSMPGS
ncbi:uncharacterized protein LOC131006872 [Salvia miltiorrhiza]|uniref:uncharacterized protein LOC131006872 n=1 Tax=Salvia miltiorrhiza TaxID=226208 RepID=UPI0025AB7DA2|nr:uncharacterized protein LOC131006872 [Salvia miltiorrhiza]